MQRPLWALENDNLYRRDAADRYDRAHGLGRADDG